MHLQKYMAKASIITLVLLMSSVSLTAMTAQAQEQIHGGTPTIPLTGGPLPAGVTPNETYTTIAYLSFSPNPIGIGQLLLVNMWLQPAIIVQRAHTGFTVTITKPDGTTETVGPMESFLGDTTAWFTYVPDQVGTYKLQFSFAGDFYPAGYYASGVAYPTPVTGSLYCTDAYYKPSQTAVYYLTVQQNFVASWPETPLPTDYWTRPISPNNREWAQIGGNDPFSGVGGVAGAPYPANTNYYMSNYHFTPYVTGPTTAHIVWRKQNAMSGLIGGATQASGYVVDFNGNSFTSGAAGPGGSGNPTIVYNGRCFMVITKNMPTIINGTYQTTTTPTWECFDLRTGQIYWDNTQDASQAPTIITYETNLPAVPGAVYRSLENPSLAYIGGGRLIKYDPSNGNVIYNGSIAPLTTGTVYADPFVLSVQTINASRGQYRLINWTLANSVPFSGGFSQGSASTANNFTARIMSNISWSFSSVGTCDYQSGIAVQTYSINAPGAGLAVSAGIEGVSLTTGQILWNVTTDMSGLQRLYSGTVMADHGKVAIRLDNGQWFGYDLYTGKKLWESPLTTYPWGSFGVYEEYSAYGLLFYNQYDGIWAYDWNTGQPVWHFLAPAPPFETPYTNGTGTAANPYSASDYSFFGGAWIADGKFYTFNVEHSPTSPIARGWRLFCVNATTGQEIWNVSDPMAPGVISDGYMTAVDYYNANMYCFGMGQSSTTVSAATTNVPLGTSVLIQGQVWDQSPATTLSPHYAPGQPVPAVSDESMTAWMDYLYQQLTLPSGYNVTGVKVQLLATDQSGSVIQIGTVQSDITGFGYAWTPPSTGIWTIRAIFAGTSSYGSSWAETRVLVGPAPTTPTTPQTQVPDYTMTIVYAAIAIIIAMIIAVAIVGILILRKK